ncbi:cob(I)yrinic acid a,c-diamide adenosyltransferase [Oceanobacillus caeni]|uniref:cob(I)yrinic acid a,c-diamide adenosyltransferase n=1 Tax=Oceanobacillus TaxID=182709 RepID=UPI000621A37A|nr:cob(I)yrinic acid a,c-diamide adenosyltransferase [Oceanobacillus caeni]KKE80320.1 ATP:cob(I)alamin adenosyltransferase [Bacilli bacterium VT-13-104]PZD81495.1 cob(I)yrinic acid a,c-diamide adenosyltransferase [Bacilli bacterium]MBU8792096.1 cob(I)yrinic acid a,c-diamide adenosyltransferase [Oceanobacillus caeni]MCR1835467.1 cob(I)yrinic acid a,c-diamide adenosyltransferase [Oceanobacillus caeni]PZD83518.1 cob(I)yrinic acid a,c-diamide adenosyltransferase [Bacilli bacterium]
MRLYTKSGDKGQTSLIGGRVDKDNIRVEAYGTLDELNSFIGKAISELRCDKKLFHDIIDDLEKIQHELFDCGTELSNVSKNKKQTLSEEPITYMENKIDELIDEAPELEKFILPGGSDASATIHIARTVARRGERMIVALMKEEEISSVPLKYVNRLSDYLFAVARVINSRLNVPDVEYARSARVFRGTNKKDKNQ